MNTHSITEADLHAYVDGRLPESRLAEIEAYLAAHPAEAERLQAYREQKAALRALFDPLLDEPLPAALRELAEPPPAGAGTPHRSFLTHWSLQRIAASFAIALLGGAAGWLGHGQYQAGERLAQVVPLARQAAVAHVVY
ncbi:MAG TPA: anti-sigma factor, partial [Azonexus sp.]|nr:anti-sigma factor [Azonexus sp.]